MRQRIFEGLLPLFVVAAFQLVGTGAALALVLHPDGEPNLATWNDRPAANVIGRWGYGASCVAVSSNCVITTQHQYGSTSTFVEIDGARYSISQIWDHNTADLRIAKLYGANLPNFVGLYEATDEIGEDIVIGGYGVGNGAVLQNQGKTYGYEWDNTVNNTLRMGTNRIDYFYSDITLGDFTSDIIIGDFDGLYEGEPTIYESVPADHDSGCGWFIKDGQTWKVAGLGRAVESHYEEDPNYIHYEEDPNYILRESWFRDSNDPNVLHPDYFDAVRISSYAQWINDTLPEVLPGDLNGDDYVDAADFSVFARYWHRTDCQGPNPCLGADSEPDGNVDWLDLADFADHWLWSAPIP